MSGANAGAEIAAHLRRALGSRKASPPLSDWLVIAWYLTIFLVCYSSVWTNNFAISDDYPDFFFGTSGTHPEKRIIEGRPLYALIGYLFTWLATDLEDLRWIRFLGVVGIAALAWSLFRALAYAGHSRFQSFCMGAIVGCSLPFQLSAAWATIAPWPYAAAISGLSTLLADRAFDEHCRGRKLALAAGAVFFLLVALAIYQPIAMFFWVFAAILLLKPESGSVGSDMAFRRFAWYCAIFVFGIALGLVTYKLGPAIYPDSHYSSRGGLIGISDIPERILWFCRPFVYALNFLVILTNYIKWILPITMVIFSFIFAGMFLYLKRAKERPFRNFLLAILLLFFSHFVMLSIERPANDYRMIPALTCLIIFYMYLAVRGYAYHLPRHLSVVRINCILGTATAVCIVLAAWQVQTCFVMPQIRELAFIRSHLERVELSGYRSVHVVRPERWSKFSPMQYAGASSYHSWTPRSMVGFVLRDLAPGHAGLTVTNSAFDDPSPPPAGSLVVDMRKGVSVHPVALRSIWPFDKLGALSGILEKIWR